MDSNVIHCDFNPKTADGGKVRMQRRRAAVKRASACDLTMDHADNGMPSDVAYAAPASDPA
jgi:hypothetical protein